MSSSSSGEVRNPRKGIPSHVLRKFLSSSSSSEDDPPEGRYFDSSEENTERGMNPKEKLYDADADLFASDYEDFYERQECSDSNSTDCISNSPLESHSQPRQESTLQRKLRSMVKKPIQNVKRALGLDAHDQGKDSHYKESTDVLSQSQTWRESSFQSSDEERSSSSPLGNFPTVPLRQRVKQSTPTKREVFPVEGNQGNYQCREPRCTTSYGLKLNLVAHMKDKHKYTSKTLPDYVKKMKEIPRKYRCPGCKGVKARIQEHYDICIAYQKLMRKQDQHKETEDEQISQRERYRQEGNTSQCSSVPSPSCSFHHCETQSGPSRERVKIDDAYEHMKECLKKDLKLSKKTKGIYKMRIKKFFRWLDKVAGIPSGEVLNMYSPSYRRLPFLEDYIMYLEDEKEKLSGSKLSQIASSYQYLCRTIINWILRNWEGLPPMHRADSERYYSGLLTSTRSSLKDYSKQQEREAEKNAGESSKRLGANTSQLVQYSKILHGDNEDIDKYYEKLYSMEKLHKRNELTHVQIRDFILLMIITSGNGSRLDALMNLTVEEWTKRYHISTDDHNNCVVNIYKHKTDIDGPVKLVFDERLEIVTELYRQHIRSAYVREHKDPGTLFVTQQGKQVSDLRNVKSLLGKFCNIPSNKLQEITLYDFRHAVANWAKSVEDRQVQEHIPGAMNHSTSIHEKRYLRDKDQAKAHIYNTFGSQINRKTSEHSTSFLRARDELAEQGTRACAAGEEYVEDTFESQETEDTDVGSLSRHVIPTHLKSSLFDILRSLPSPPGKSLRDIHINQAFRLKNFEELFEQLKERAVHAKEQKGRFLDTEIEREREAKRLLKSSWRSMYREW